MSVDFWVMCWHSLFIWNISLAGSWFPKEALTYKCKKTECLGVIYRTLPLPLPSPFPTLIWNVNVPWSQLMVEMLNGVLVVDVAICMDLTNPSTLLNKIKTFEYAIFVYCGYSLFVNIRSCQTRSSFIYKLYFGRNLLKPPRCASF